jgi:peroxiredoxin
MHRVLAVAVALAAGCGDPSGPKNPGSTKGDGVAAGAQATDFTLRDVDGKTVRLSDYQGKVVLIDFWATWCVPCEAEIPHLQELFAAQQDKGFVVLGVSMDGPETIANVGSFARRYNLTFPILLDEETKVVGVYNPKRTAPLQVLIDRKGQIAKVRQGYNAGDEKLIAAEVQGLL